MIIDNHKCKTGYGAGGGSSLGLWVGMAGGEAEEMVELEGFIRVFSSPSFCLLDEVSYSRYSLSSGSQIFLNSITRSPALEAKLSSVSG